MNTTEMMDVFAEFAAITAVQKPVRKKPAPKHDFGDGRGKVFAHRHSNGEGWVADTANVSEKVFVSKRAKIYHYAVVKDNCQINGNAAVCGESELSENTRVDGEAFVAGHTDAKNCRIYGTARLYGGKLVNTEIHGNARITGDPVIVEAKISGQSFVTGRAKVTSSNIYGNSVIAGRSFIMESTTHGFVRLFDSAFVLRSTLQQHTMYARPLENISLCIKDNAMIANVNLLSAVILIKGHGTVVGGQIHFTPVMDRNGEVQRIECVDALCLPNVTITSLSEFERYNHENPGLRLGTAAELARRVDATRFNMNNLVPRRRLSPV
jgi:carbonic anhydrase/acetyltransferase-like protein (isoleucine patch superfamily)